MVAILPYHADRQEQFKISVRSAVGPVPAIYFHEFEAFNNDIVRWSSQKNQLMQIQFFASKHLNDLGYMPNSNLHKLTLVVPNNIIVNWTRTMEAVPVTLQVLLRRPFIFL